MPFKIVQTIERGKFVLSIIPHNWEKNGTLYWPRKNVDILRKFDQSDPDDNWLTYGCILKRTNLATYQKAEYEMAKMNIQSETRNDESGLKLRKQSHQLLHTLDDSDNESNSNSYPITPVSKTEISLDLDYDEEVATEGHINFELQQESSSRTDVLSRKLNTVLQNNKIILENMASIQQKIKLLNDGQQTILYYFDQMKVNLDSAINSQSVAEKHNINVELVKSLEDFDKLENLLKNPENEKELRNKYSIICGVGKGRGVNNAYELIDAIFERNFLPKCSWAGGSKTGESKICFKSYTHTINFFFNLVHMADNTFSLTDCHDFFKTILRNSRQRCASKHMRKSAAKTRRKKKELCFSNDPLDTTEAPSELCLEQSEDQTNQSTDEDM